MSGTSGVGGDAGPVDASYDVVETGPLDAALAVLGTFFLGRAMMGEFTGALAAIVCCLPCAVTQTLPVRTPAEDALFSRRV